LSQEGENNYPIAIALETQEYIRLHEKIVSRLSRPIFSALETPVPPKCVNYIIAGYPMGGIA